MSLQIKSWTDWKWTTSHLESIREMKMQDRRCSGYWTDWQLSSGSHGLLEQIPTRANHPRNQCQGRKAWTVTDKVLGATLIDNSQSLKFQGPPGMGGPHNFIRFTLHEIYWVLTVNIREQFPWASGRKREKETILENARTHPSSQALPAGEII